MIAQKAPESPVERELLDLVDKLRLAASRRSFGSLDWLEEALIARGIDVSMAAGPAPAAVIAIDHYRAERAGNPLANVDAVAVTPPASPAPPPGETLEALILAMAAAHDANVTGRERGALSAVEAGNDTARRYWTEIARAVSTVLSGPPIETSAPKAHVERHMIFLRREFDHDTFNKVQVLEADGLSVTYAVLRDDGLLLNQNARVARARFDAEFVAAEGSQQAYLGEVLAGMGFDITYGAVIARAVVTGVSIKTIRYRQTGAAPLVAEQMVSQRDFRRMIIHP